VCPALTLCVPRHSVEPAQHTLVQPPAAPPARAWARARADQVWLCQWQGDTPSILGSGLDELMRHVAGLRSDGITVVLHILRRLCLLGGLADAHEAGGPAEGPPATSAAAGADALASGAEAGAQPAGGRETGAGSGAMLQGQAPAPAAQGERGTDGAAPGDGGAGADAAVPAGEAGPSGGSGPVAMQTDGAAAPGSPAAAAAPGGGGGGGGGAPAAQPDGSLEALGWEALAPVAPPVPPPPAAGGGGGGGGGGPTEAPAAGGREGAAQPAAAGAAPPLDLSGEPEPGPAADAGAWLAESVSHAARMLEPLLGTADSAREFMARGGARALLARPARPLPRALFNSCDNLNKDDPSSKSGCSPGPAAWRRRARRPREPRRSGAPASCPALT